MSYHARKSIPQQLTGIGFVVLVHIVVIYVMASGLGKSIVEIALPPIETKVIEEEKQVEAEPPPPPPKMEAIPPYVPPPELQIAAEPVAAPTKAITTSSQPAPPKPAAKDVIVQAKVNPRHPLERPDYPASEKRAGHEGAVLLNIYVDESGRVTQAKVEKTSGFPALDEAAVRQALRSWRLIPGTKNGTPAAGWVQISMRFTLKE
jgi:periplasmic protein TonB